MNRVSCIYAISTIGLNQLLFVSYKHVTDIQKRYAFKINYVFFLEEAVLMLRDTKIHDGKMHVLDLACGKGGDLNKWRNASCMEYLVAVDISPGSISNCQLRYEGMKRRNRYLFDAKFIVADCTRVTIILYLIFYFISHFPCCWKKKLTKFITFR